MLVLVPFVVALVRAFGDGSVPSGDEANIAIRALDVFSRHPPLTGLPSTSGLYGGGIQANHPGPIEFYLLAAPLRVLGISAGSLLTAATVNAACGLIALWAIFRRLGLTAMLWGSVLLLAVIWSAGTAVLTDTLSSNMTMYSLLGAALLMWALIDGDLALMPVTVLVASYAAQQHLAAGLVVLALLVVTAVMIVVQIATRVRGGDTTIMATVRRWTPAAGIVGVVCWAPVIGDELSGHPGNLTSIVRFARDNTRATLGLHSGWVQALRAATPPTMLGRTDTTGSFFLDGLGPYRSSLGIAVVAALAVTVWSARARFAALARLALVALVLLVAGLVNGSNVPRSFEAGRVNLYRWAWAAAFATYLAVGIAVVFLISRIFASSSPTRLGARYGPPALIAVAALIAASIAGVSGRDDHDPQVPAFAPEKRIAAAVLATVDRRRPVVVIGDGFSATQAIAPYVILRLAQAGIDVEVPSAQTGAYGRWRRYRPRSAASAIVISTGARTVPPAPGRLLFTYSTERDTIFGDTRIAVHLLGPDQLSSSRFASPKWSSPLEPANPGA